MKLNRKILSLLIILLTGMTSLYARSYPVVTELPGQFFLRNIGSDTWMEARSNEIRLYRGNINNKYQQWYAFKSGSDGDFRLRNNGAGRYLKVETRKTGGIINNKQEILGVSGIYTKVKFLAINDTRFFIKLDNGKVADAKGGGKKFLQGQEVIPYELNGHSNQMWYIYYLEGKKLKLFNYKSYGKEKNSAQNIVNQPVNNNSDSSENKLSRSLRETAISFYMKRTCYSQFTNDNKNNVLRNHINGLRQAAQYRYIITVLKSVIDNSDADFRRAIYSEIYSVNTASLPVIYKTAIRNRVQKTLTKESNSSGKSYLERLMIKFQ